jgi:hydroxylysine kinase
MGALLDAPLPVVSLQDVAEIARSQYGLSVTVQPLTGERDRNFHLRADDGTEFALRVINPEETADVSDFQSRALEHLARVAPDVPVPRLRRPSGSEHCEALWQPPGGPPCRVRVLDYLSGHPLPVSGAKQRHAIGTLLGTLDAGLRTFRHPAEDHRLLWDIQHAIGLRGLLPHVPGDDDRVIAATVLDRFEAHVLPLLGQLRCQVIHNDFNPHNILVKDGAEDVVTGIIDFGDMVRAPLIQDLATAGAYQIVATEHPLEGPADLARAFHAVLPLLPEEIAVLADLVATRLATTVLISGLRARRQPDNAAYILRNYPRSIDGLRRIAAIPRAEAQSFLQARLRP